MESEQIPIRRRRISGLDVCDVTTDELDSIEREGSNVGLDFQIAQGCLVVALSFLATLLTVKIQSERTFTVFVVIVAVGLFGATAFGLKWFQSRKSFARLIQKIRDRQVGSVGQEGKELTPGELVTKPQQLAPIRPDQIASPVPEQAADLAEANRINDQVEREAK
jgi:hypothetical protein